MSVPHAHATPTALLKTAAQCPGPESMQCPPIPSQLQMQPTKGMPLNHLALEARTTVFLGIMDLKQKDSS